MSQPPPPAFPPQPYYPPPKKSNVGKIVGIGCLVVALLGVLAVGACTAMFATVGKQVADEADKIIKENEANDTPTAVTVGSEFEHDDFTIDRGWRIVDDGTSSATIEGLKVTNASASSRSAELTFSLYKESENLGSIKCSSNEIATDESSAMSCYSTNLTSRWNTYSTVKVADSW